MKTIFIDSGLDKHLAEKIRKGQVYNNVPERLPQREVKIQTLYKALERGKSFLNGFSLPTQEEEQLRKALDVISKAAEDAERKKKEAIFTEEDLIQALETLTELAREQKG
jgi:hypothetical protein